MKYALVTTTIYVPKAVDAYMENAVKHGHKDCLFVVRPGPPCWCKQGCIASTDVLPGALAAAMTCFCGSLPE